MNDDLKLVLMFAALIAIASASLALAGGYMIRVIHDCQHECCEHVRK